MISEFNNVWSDSQMRPHMSIEQKLKGHCYLRLQDGETPSKIHYDLLAQGFVPSQIDIALSQAVAALKEYARYKNIELLKTLSLAIAVFIFGVFLSQNSETAPGQFQDLYFKVYLLAAGIVAYGIWARSQKV